MPSEKEVKGREKEILDSNEKAKAEEDAERQRNAGEDTLRRAREDVDCETRQLASDEARIAEEKNKKNPEGSRVALLELSRANHQKRLEAAQRRLNDLTAGAQAATQPVATQTGATQPTATQPAVAQTGATQSGVTSPPAPQSGAAPPGVSQAGVALPVVVPPVVVPPGPAPTGSGHAHKRVKLDRSRIFPQSNTTTTSTTTADVADQGGKQQRTDQPNDGQGEKKRKPDADPAIL